MKEKRQQIIESAIKLFARKGYHATSMQEIADASGVAKGSVYNYFDSKENLLLSIFKHYYELMIEKISLVSDDDSLSPKEKLGKQIHLQFEEFLRYQDFIEMQMREQAVQINDEITRFLLQLRAETLEWYRSKIIEVYDKDVHPYAIDLATILNAIISEYMGYLIFEKIDIDLWKLSQFIIDRLDDLATGLAAKQPEPILKKGIRVPKAEPTEAIHVEVRCIRDLTANLGNQKDISESLELLEKEMASDQPKKVIMQGMLAFLKDIDHPDIQKHVNNISEMLSFSR